MTHRLTVPLAMVLASLACLSLSAEEAAGQAPNTLSDAERAEGWILLFDGRSTDGWKSFRRDTFPTRGWMVTNDCLRHVAQGKGGDIITRRTFSDYDFRFEWRMLPGGNSGVKYFITEQRTSAIGHEYQILEASAAELASMDPRHAPAGFYDVLPTSVAPPLKPAGTWNSGRIVVRGANVQHWVNGVQVLQYQLGSETVRAGIARSKFRDVAGFGTAFPHHVLLQDHGGDIAFRNLKLLPLTP